MIFPFLITHQVLYGKHNRADRDLGKQKVADGIRKAQRGSLGIGKRADRDSKKHKRADRDLGEH